MQNNMKIEFKNTQTLRVCKSSFDNKKPLLFVLVGLPGSGKSTLANMMVEAARSNGDRFEIVSSDAIRNELYLSEENQENNQQVFNVAHARIKHYLSEGISVVFDATNISKKRRIAFLNGIKSIPCYTICYALMVPYPICVERNQKRDRVVPTDVIRRMYLNWEPPHRSEGFDEVHFVRLHNGIDDWSQYTLDDLVSRMNGFILFDQENKHHSHTLGVHCIAAMMSVLYMDRANTRLQIAALLHDIGKAFTKSRTNHKGEYDGNCHYYQHHCVSAYDSLFYLYMLSYDDDDMAHISNVIFYHMHPHRNWKQSENAMNRDRRIMGEELFSDVMMLHAADLHAQ